MQYLSQQGMSGLLLGVVGRGNQTGLGSEEGGMTLEDTQLAMCHAASHVHDCCVWVHTCGPCPEHTQEARPSREMIFQSSDGCRLPPNTS